MLACENEGGVKDEVQKSVMENQVLFAELGEQISGKDNSRHAKLEVNMQARADSQ